MTYAYLPKVNCGRGAPMGRFEFNESPGVNCVGSILPLAMHEGYDSGGAYWGTPNNVWVANYSFFKPGATFAENKEFYGRRFVRADSRDQAIKLVHAIRGWENVRFRKSSCHTWERRNRKAFK